MAGGARSGKQNQTTTQTAAAPEEILQREQDLMIECEDLRQVTELIAHLMQLRNQDARSETTRRPWSNGEASDFENPFHMGIPSHRREGRGDSFE